jgi:hypothetical protein
MTQMKKGFTLIELTALLAMAAAIRFLPAVQ